MKLGEFDGKSLDARIVDTWLIRMTNYLTLTNTPADKMVSFASSYLANDALDRFINNNITLTVM